MTYENIIDIITDILKIISVTFIISLVLYLLFNISLYFKELRNYQFMINRKEHEDRTEEVLNDRVSSTVEFLDFCNAIIDNEIAKNLSGYSRLNKKYDMTKFDVDYENIATSVYDSIKPEIIENKNLIITSKFIMQHIIDESMIRFMKYTRDYNNAINKNN